MNERERRSIGEQIETLRGEFRLGLQDLRKDFDSARRGIYGRLDTLNGTVATNRDRISALEGIAHDSKVVNAILVTEWKVALAGTTAGAAIMTAIFTILHLVGVF